MNEADFELHTFSNGLRLVHKQITSTKVAHCGFIMDVGSRDEKTDEQGLAHFWEHMAFKGTARRKTFHILNALESVGGELNAYTTKEKVCFYASVLSQHFKKAVDILTDITFRSTFPLRELEKERSVILEEMAMYVDTPDEAISDDFDKLLFGNHALSRNILGTTQSIKEMQGHQFADFIADIINPDRLIFSSVSNLSLKEVIRQSAPFLENVIIPKGQRVRASFNQEFTPSRQIEKKSFSQAHCVMGTKAYSIREDRRHALVVLTNLLGGPGMSSRLNLLLREKYGFVYSADAQYISYTDTGAFNIYFATEQKQWKRGVQLILKELKKLRDTPLGTTQLHRAKQQLIGQIAIAEESNLSLMLGMGKSILDFERIDPLLAIFEKIESITAGQLQEVAQELFKEDQMAMLSFLPEDAL